MKTSKPFYFMVLAFAMILQLTGCGGHQEAVTKTATNFLPMVASSVSAQAQSAVSEAFPTASEPSASTSALEETKMNHITIEIGGKSFSATLADNQAAKEFAAYLPMTVNMTEMNGQEKFYGLPDHLPADTAERPSTIHSGDIFCWSGNTLVLFYNTFSNSYGGYVRLGAVDDPAGLAAAVGSENVEVTWSLTK